MFKITLRESSALRIIANAADHERHDIVTRFANILNVDAKEIAHAMIDDVNCSDKAKIAAKEFLLAAKERSGW